MDYDPYSMGYEDLIHETLKVSPNSIHSNVLSILKLENKNVFLASNDQGESLVQQIIFNSFYSFRQGSFIWIYTLMGLQ